MALFNKKENTKAKASKEVTKETTTSKAGLSDQPKADSGGKTVPVVSIQNVRTHNPHAVLLRPRITEKASFAEERQLYVFEIDPRATKKDVSDAMRHIYNVKPVKINITKIPAKQYSSQVRRVRGVKSGGKKAYVYLKKGDSIQLI